MIDLSKYEESNFFLHYTFNDNNAHDINVDTFANSLVQIAEIMRSISKYTITTHELEIVLDKTGDGTFWGKLKLKGRNIFTKALEFLPLKNDTIPILISLIALFNQNSVKESKTEGNVLITNNHVVINNNIKISKDIYDKCMQLKALPEVRSCMQKVFRSLEDDETVEKISIAKTEEEVKKHSFLVSVDRKEFKNFNFDDTDSTLNYDVRQGQILTPIKTVLERSSRKWEFVWDGKRISARISCDKFYNDLANGRISIKPRDTMVTTLKIKQRLDKINNVYINEDYEIIFVEKYENYVDPQFNLEL